MNISLMNCPFICLTVGRIETNGNGEVSISSAANDENVGSLFFQVGNRQENTSESYTHIERNRFWE